MPRVGTIYAKRFTVTSWDDMPPDFFGDEVRYSVFGREVCPTSKKEHWQGYVELVDRTLVTQLKLYDDAAHFEVARGSPYDNYRYCTKDSLFIEYNEQYRPEKGRKIDYKRQMDLAREWKLDDMDSGIRFRDMKKIKEHYFDHMCSTIKDLDPGVRTGIWIHAASGIGKSHFVREHFKPLYLKAHNKWWDSYQFEPNVLFDDLDKYTAVWCMTHLKIWADRYAYAAEFKGGLYPRIRPRYIIVTSQYKPQDLIKEDDPELLEAIRRRFHILTALARSGFSGILERIFPDGIPSQVSKEESSCSEILEVTHL